MRCDGVLWTDGYFLSQLERSCADKRPRVGWVYFDEVRDEVICSNSDLPPNVVDSWNKRSNQISMVEMFAPPLALCTLGKP